MKLHIKTISIVFGILFYYQARVWAQDIPVGSWRTHYSFNNTFNVTQTNQTIYVASAAGIFSVDKTELSTLAFTKLNGLSDTDVASIHANQQTQTVIIAYKSGQLDILQDNTLISLSDIRLSDILDDKTVYSMFDDGIYTYLCSSFGMVKLDTNEKIIAESYLNLGTNGTNLPVFAGTLYNDSLFVATQDGIMAGSLLKNLKDYSLWYRFDSADGFYPKQANVMAMHDNAPISATSSQGVLTYVNGKWMATSYLIGAQFRSITSSDQTLIIANDSLFVFSNQGVSPISSTNFVAVKDALSQDATLWVADAQNGLVQLAGGQSQSIYPNGPYFNTVSKLIYQNQQIFAIPQYQLAPLIPAQNQSGFSIFKDGLWVNYSSNGYPNTNLIPKFFDISGVSEWAGNTVISSYGYGLMFWGNDGKFTVVDETNSPLINSNPPNRNVLIADIDTDNANLWMLCNNTDTSVFAYDNSSNWFPLTPSGKVAHAKSIISTAWGDQWITLYSIFGGGILVYNSSGQELYLTAQGNGTIPSNSVNQILMDKEEKIWIATTKGVVYYTFPAGIFDDPTQEAIIPIIDSNLLFNNEPVNCLAVDGGNRIWMGTSKGAWLFDKDGAELVEHFTTENSPLLSDEVLSIAINDQSGEVFFNTAKGLISYRGTGTVTGTYDEPKIFPNPVHPDYTGVVTIEGVPTNSLVKITDASGRLVTELNANGNTAVWNLQNSFSSSITTGVYFVFVASPDGSATQFGKIAVIK